MCHYGNTEVEWTLNKSKHTKLTLEKKILPPFLPGFEQPFDHESKLLYALISGKQNLIHNLFGVHSTPHVTAVACKRAQSFCQTCRWQVTLTQAYTLEPTKSEWVDYAAVQV